MGKWSSFKEQQLLVESFREFVSEREEQATNTVTASDVLGQDFVQFVNSLNSNKE